ncbi:hypothetical protein M569_09733 [Genlisea aurea]|uniref:Copper transport protein n=1 Tax=Genlisea aurea TaxID=192259 RepID=S8DYI7_9LAMI|nr:hypothetical protein M569_09733 [Genlisea aurea]
MMHMTLYWGKDVTILFDSWKTDSWFSYSVSLFACLLSALFYQYMEARRIRLNLLSYLPPPESPAEDPLLGSKLRRARNLRIDRLIAAILVAVNAAIGYLLMLAIMSFNGGVLLAVVLGLGIGYLLFRGDEYGGPTAVVLESSCACA